MVFILAYFDASSKFVGEGRFILVAFRFATKVICDSMSPAVRDRFSIFI